MSIKTTTCWPFAGPVTIDYFTDRQYGLKKQTKQILNIEIVNFQRNLSCGHDKPWLLNVNAMQISLKN